MEWIYPVSLYLIIVNVAAFGLYGRDKYKAKRDLWRIPEATLLGIAVFGGSIGAWCGMHIFHHKTRKPRFYVGIPVIFLIQLAVGFWLIR